MNDTLTLSPTASWAVSTGRHLVIDAKDTAGRLARTVNLAYDIYRGILYYVSYFTGKDANTGMSPLTAFQNLDYAVNNVSPTATILVATGSYNVSSGATDTRIWLRQDISLYGGYNYDFTVRKPASYPSVIRDITGAVVGTAANPNFAVIADNVYAVSKDGTGSTITNTTLVDGFTIQGMLNVPTATADYTTAIRVHSGAAPAFANNWIFGGEGKLESIGILAVDSAPLIYNNAINGGFAPTTLGASNFTFGIYASGAAATPTIINNLVYGGDNTISSSAYYLVNGAGVLRNNILSGGSGTSNSIAVSLVSGTMVSTNPNIDNNILFTRTGAGTTVCLNESTSGGDSTPASFRNNDLFDCAVLYVDNQLGCNSSSNCTSIAQVNGLAVASANVAVNPQFANIYGPDGVIGSLEDNDWHFSAVSPVSVTAGGLNGIDQGWSFITDKDNVVRPASGTPWSMGAYEPAP